LKGLDYVTLFPLGDDSTIITNLEGGEGSYSYIVIYRRKGELLERIYSADGMLWDYSEDGHWIVGVVDGEMAIIRGDGGINTKYRYRPLRRVWISSTGRYIAQIGAGKYVGIFNNKGELIKEHHVQGQGNYYAAFSPDEKYLCVTPGPWRIYFFETKTGKMLWEYDDLAPDSFSFFYSPVVSDAGILFIGSSCWQPLSVLNSAKQNKKIFLFGWSGNLLGTSEVFPVENEEAQEFYTWNPTPLLKITKNGEYLSVRTPSNLLLFRVINEGGE
jgi:hypothetical protein